MPPVHHVENIEIPLMIAHGEKTPKYHLNMHYVWSRH